MLSHHLLQEARYCVSSMKSFTILSTYYRISSGISEIIFACILSYAYSLACTQALFQLLILSLLLELLIYSPRVQNLIILPS